jgi:hypothetical protein
MRSPPTFLLIYLEYNMADFRIVKKTKCRTKYKGIGVDTLQHIRWQPKIYSDPFIFDFDVVKQRIEDRRQAGYEDDVSTIKRNIVRVCGDNPGTFDDFLQLLEA